MKIIVSTLVLLVITSAQPLTPCSFQQSSKESPLVQEVLVALNTLRSNPSSFVPKLAAYRDYMRTRAKNTAALDAAIKEATDRLSSEKALPVLNMSGGLWMAAKDHAADIEKNGVLGHTGTDKSTPAQRVKKYMSLPLIGEVVTYGFSSADLILASFIVDQDTPDRGHRENLLNGKFTMVGIAIAEHKKYGTSCVIVLGGI